MIQSVEVSVIIPTYNRFDFLKQAIESVLAQTFPALELVVVDDGSTDGTRAYLNDVPDKRVQSLLVPHTGNIARLRNTGASYAVGRYFCFLDSDDLWVSSKLAVQLTEMLSRGAPWSYTRYQLIDEKGRLIARERAQARALSGNIALELITGRASVALCTVLLERNLFIGLGGFDEDPGLVLREDYEFLVRLCLAAHAHAIDEQLAQVRDHEGRATRNWAGRSPFLTTAYAYDKLLRIVNEKHMKRALRHRRAFHLAEAGAEYLRAGSIGAATHCFLRSALDGVEARHWASALVRGTGLRKSAIQGQR